VRLLLERVEAVPKSSFQKPGERPSARRHYETIQAHAELLTTPRLTLVDDFVTKGNTLLGGASRLAETFPAMRLAAFALVRTRGLQPDVADLVEPCVGRVVRVGDDWAEREP
jgi:adenine/guanine phosphoribosyltransferase-like PRPP-binding protein